MSGPIIVAGGELYASLQAEKLGKVEETGLGFNSEQLCVLQRDRARRGIVGAEIVRSIYGYSVRYDSGLQEWGLLKPARGSRDPSFAAALAFCEAWVAQDPARRYAWHRETHP